MGSAIAERIKAKFAVTVFDKDAAKTKGAAGVRVALTLAGLVKDTDALVLAVKPQDFDLVLTEIKEQAENKLVISIAAGITTGYIEKNLGGARVVRVMPNIAAKIGEAESALCKGMSAHNQDLELSQLLFNAIGRTWIMKEEMIDAATAISGSGPAYIFYDMEKNGILPESLSEEKKQEYIRRLTEAAGRVGFDPDVAQELASATTGSCTSLCSATHTPPSELRRQVTSKGGTTEAALKVLAEGGSWADAAEAALKRAKELSKS